MVKSWFEAKYGSSKKISPPERQTRSVVGEKDLAYYFAETFQITPSWSNEQISTYLNKYPIVIVSVEPIEHLDARNFGYVLIFYRDSLNQIDGRLQVYDANPNYRKTHKTYDVKDFSGQFFQITLEGKVEKLLFINNGQIQLAAKLGTNSNTSTSTLKPRGLCSQCLNIYDEHRTPLENAWCWICELLHSDGGGGTTLIATTDPGFGPPNADLFNTNNYVGNTNYGGYSLSDQINNRIFYSRDEVINQLITEGFPSSALENLSFYTGKKFYEKWTKYREAGFLADEFLPLYNDKVLFSQVDGFLDASEMNPEAIEVVMNYMNQPSV